MQILPIDPSFQRVILQGNASTEGIPLTLGQQITATVMKINAEGQLLLNLGSKRFWARSELPLTEGQQITLKVDQLGPTIELRLIDSPAEASVENYPLAALLQAGAGSDLPSLNAIPAEILETLQHLFQSEPPALTQAQRQQLTQLLQPLSVSSNASELFPQLKNLLENSGLFFEGKLRGLLETLKASPEESLQRLASDLKSLIGQLNRNLIGDPVSQLEIEKSSPNLKGQNLPPELEARVERREQPVKSSPETTEAQWKEALLNQKGVLTEQLLSRQADVAYQWMKEGAFQAELPIQFGSHSTQAKIRFFQGPSKNLKERKNGPLSINVYLDLPQLGKLEAWARWQDARIETTLYVQDTAAREAFAPHLEDLSRGLQAAGFDNVKLEIAIDPVRLYKPIQNAEEPLPEEGSLLSLRV